MAITLNTPVGSKIRCVSRNNLVGGGKSGDPVVVGRVYTLAAWCGGEHSYFGRTMRLEETSWFCAPEDFDLISLPEDYDGNLI